jgi:chorismate mutase/prephenate dehydratase
MAVGEVKKEFNAPVFRPEREAQVLRQLADKNPGPLQNAGLQAIWREVMSACRALESVQAVAYLGPAGTFSEAATRQHFGSSVQGLLCPTIDEVFRAVQAGRAEFGVVPVENSTEGSINRTLDLLLQTEVQISGEITLAIVHNLLHQTGNLSQIKTVVSHAQSLGQCVGWLNAHYPHIERRAVASNAEAARMAAADLSLLAIASGVAATEYGLHIIKPAIQDDPSNKTRFVVIGKQATQRTGSDQTSLILAVPNQAGAVLKILQPLAAHGVSMSRFESRPAKSGAWEYFFYIDIQGHAQDANVAAALAELQSACAFYKNLGSYPRTR